MTEASKNFPKVLTPPSLDAGESAGAEEETLSPHDREKFIEQALANYESALIGYATTILYDLDRARDVVQDTFIRLCEQDLSKLRGGLKPWLYTVCRNRALDIHRRDKRSQPLDDMQWKNVAGPDLQPDEQVDQHERMAELMGYLNRLTANQREVIILKFQQGLSYQDIQKVTDLSTSNIGFLIHTGLKRLREFLPDDLRA